MNSKTRNKLRAIMKVQWAVNLLARQSAALNGVSWNQSFIIASQIAHIECMVRMTPHCIFYIDRPEVSERRKKAWQRLERYKNRKLQKEGKISIPGMVKGNIITGDHIKLAIEALK